MTTKYKQPPTEEQLSAQFGSAFAAAFEGGQSGAAVPEAGTGVLIGLCAMGIARRRRSVRRDTLR